MRGEFEVTANIDQQLRRHFEALAAHVVDVTVGQNDIVHCVIVVIDGLRTESKKPLAMAIESEERRGILKHPS